jgi:hypothetical protein
MRSLKPEYSPRGEQADNGMGVMGDGLAPYLRIVHLLYC